ncbi:lipoyl(octanoyl) transferase [Chytriomyces confervae]|uniref:lipoyl(octanoyl) transferase n=1 Tax=Chytriomyces confervae TaxID=246404 RepID=A0A507FCR4_9FUNG|nr:hypothetical protein HDU80_002819 [Chytriomyces hyalinus]TPX73068.1 lipoyl(octanoyl) transferase [Chytriomyces confervae]
MIAYHHIKKKVPYGIGLKLLEHLVTQRLNNPNMPNLLLLLEHEPVYTAGRRLKGSALAEEAMRIKKTNGLDIFETARGGQTTFHGPGQLVGYPVLDLRTIVARNSSATTGEGKFNHRGTTVRGFVAGIEDSIIRACEGFGVPAVRTSDTGVWASQDRKLAALGVQVSRYITSHGFALNCNVDLSYFDAIVPCGLEDKRATSLTFERRLANKSPEQVTVSEAVPAVCAGIESVFNVQVSPLSVVDQELETQIDASRGASPRAKAGTSAWTKGMFGVIAVVFILVVGFVTVLDFGQDRKSSHQQRLVSSSAVLKDERGEDLDLAQARMLDYLNGELDSPDDDRIFGGSLQDMAKQGHEFNPIATWRFLNTTTPLLLDSHIFNPLDYRELGCRARHMYIHIRLLESKHANELGMSTNVETLESTVAQFQQSLFPWLKPTFESFDAMLQSFRLSPDPVGLVITGGTKHFYLIMGLILSLQREFLLTIPIHVYYAGPKDLKPSMVDAFNKLPNVTAIDLLTLFPNETALWSGWSLKPFAMLAAPFQTVLFLDADSMFFQNPLHALDSDAFKTTGQLFFHDRRIRERHLITGPKLLNSMVHHLSRYSRSIAYTNAEQDWFAETQEMDSGFIAVNKSDTGVLMSLLLTTKLNSNDTRALLYKDTHGDKESFWFASEMLRVPFRFNKGFVGAMGTTAVISPPGYHGVCSSFMLQVDDNGDLFWWNGGGVLNDRDITSGFSNHFAQLDEIALDLDGEDSWWFWFFTGGGCLGKKRKYVRSLSKSEVDLLERFRDIFRFDIKQYESLAENKE